MIKDLYDYVINVKGINPDIVDFCFNVYGTNAESVDNLLYYYMGEHFNNESVEEEEIL